MDELLMDKPRLRYLLIEERDCFMITYIEQKFSEESWSYQKYLMLEHPYFANKILDDFELNDEEKKDIFFKNLVYHDGGGGRIVLVDGSKGGGKTAFGCWVLDEYKKLKPYTKFFFITRAINRPKLPDWIKVIDSVEGLENDCVAVVDEGAIQLSSRRHSTRENKEASDRLVVLRHRGITLIILVQNIKMVDTNVRRLADLRVLKYGIPFGSEDKQDEDLELIRTRLKPRNEKETYVEILSKKKHLKFTNGLPEWFDIEKTSKSFKQGHNLTKSEKDFKKMGDALDVLK